MDMNKLTEKAQEAIAAAQRLAESRQHTQLEPEHLLAALVLQENGVVPALLEKLGVSPRQVSQRLDAALAKFARSQSPQQVYASPRFRRTFEAAPQAAELLKEDFVRTEYFFLAAVDEPIFQELGLPRDKVLKALQDV